MSMYKNWHRIPISVDLTSCCAVAEIHGLSFGATPEQQMADFVWHTARLAKKAGIDFPACGHAIFSGVTEVARPDEVGRVPTGYGEAFAAYVCEKRLGKVVQSGPAPNPHHEGRHVAAWLWEIDVKALTRWGVEKGVLHD